MRDPGTESDRFKPYGILLLIACVAVPVFAAQESDIFETKVRPILVNRCGACHGDKTQMAGLKLITAEGFFKGADTGPIVVKGDPARSRIIQAISYTGAIKMPPTGKLDPDEIDILTKWVASGAPWPKAPVRSVSPPTGSPPVWDQKRTSHWAFQPVKNLTPPEVTSDWIRTPIDRFILAQLNAKGLRPAPPADKLTLLRRVKFDLHGLPPTEQEIRDFLADSSPDAYEKLVDRLLASPRYGEQWGRHWLDVARYADTSGRDADRYQENAWRYRDYVIDAFNRDLPYDQFVREQLAGDLTPAQNPGEVNVRGIVATGFLALGPRAVSATDKVRQFYDTVDEEIDTTSKAFLGLTLACARCHDHKFDPISTRDYYSLAGIFASTKVYEVNLPMNTVLYQRPLVPEAVYRAYKEHQDRIAAKQTEIDAIIEPAAAHYVIEKMRPKLGTYMIAAHQVYQDHVPTTKTAAEAELDAKLLEKWADYLKPASEFRPYLERWYQARPAELPDRAREYGRMYDGPARRYYDALWKWEREVAEKLRRGNNPARKPGFGAIDLQTPDERFFLEIAFGTGPFAIENEIKEKLLTKAQRDRVAELREELKALTKSAPPKPPMAHAAAEGDIIEQRVFVRGNAENQGPPSPKQFPEILAGTNQTPITHGSGRKELAEWITRPDNRLTSRVMANRIWLRHFGEGLVRTPDNFGVAGEAPTHPELLDWLAAEFVRRQWSIKPMHRQILLSSTYRMSTQSSARAREADPENRWWSHFSPRRLTVEEMRDSMLSFDGKLDLTMGGTDKIGMGKEKGEARPVVNADKSTRRSVYITLVRNKLPYTFTLFDFVDAHTPTSKRNETNVATQALFLINSEFVYDRSRSLAQFLLRDTYTSDGEKVARAYRIVYGRPATAEDIDQQLAYIRSYPQGNAAGADTRPDAWQSFCHVLMESNEFANVN
jgi:hypothetical protein